MIKNKNKNLGRCDICGNEAYTTDWFCLICHDCRSKYYNLNLLKRIGNLCRRIEQMEKKYENRESN